MKNKITRLYLKFNQARMNLLLAKEARPFYWFVIILYIIGTIRVTYSYGLVWFYQNIESILNNLFILMMVFVFGLLLWLSRLVEKNESENI